MENYPTQNEDSFIDRKRDCDLTDSLTTKKRVSQELYSSIPEISVLNGPKFSPTSNPLPFQHFMNSEGNIQAVQNESFKQPEIFTQISTGLQTEYQNAVSSFPKQNNIPSTIVPPNFEIRNENCENVETTKVIAGLGNLDNTSAQQITNHLNVVDQQKREKKEIPNKKQNNNKNENVIHVTKELKITIEKNFEEQPTQETTEEKEEKHVGKKTRKKRTKKAKKEKVEKAITPKLRFGKSPKKTKEDTPLIPTVQILEIKKEQNENNGKQSPLLTQTEKQLPIEQKIEKTEKTETLVDEKVEVKCEEKNIENKKSEQKDEKKEENEEKENCGGTSNEQKVKEIETQPTNEEIKKTDEPLIPPSMILEIKTQVEETTSSKMEEEPGKKEEKEDKKETNTENNKSEQKDEQKEEDKKEEVKKENKKENEDGTSNEQNEREIETHWNEKTEEAKKMEEESEETDTEAVDIDELQQLDTDIFTTTFVLKEGSNVFNPDKPFTEWLESKNKEMYGENWKEVIRKEVAETNVEANSNDSDEGKTTEETTENNKEEDLTGKAEELNAEKELEHAENKAKMKKNVYTDTLDSLQQKIFVQSKKQTRFGYEKDDEFIDDEDFDKVPRRTKAVEAKVVEKKETKPRKDKEKDKDKEIVETKRKKKSDRRSKKRNQRKEESEEGNEDE
ncbi:hypothetical protein EIN_523760 [Entamoeba invadens IP1]|uniref:Uncharacterized protein n=1 Tax=Entamoeba invadens IP1 TaxID=370355 RepID=A0A0A1UGA5_ENTIV|nr:hypothetical protein EIN_523760 [Entamoeba invadens IP1]ELP92478.1 hypothetical protein EIN_523760 [Entamoeba invadens IP1]|eukprot:XP_004259249.1 hypothetical protein EIN_523760 [Entamoeba invadens IP1]